MSPIISEGEHVNGGASQESLSNEQCHYAELYYAAEGSIPRPASAQVFRSGRVAFRKDNASARTQWKAAVFETYHNLKSVDQTRIFNRSVLIATLNTGQVTPTTNQWFQDPSETPHTLRLDIASYKPVNGLVYLPTEWEPTIEKILQMVNSYVQALEKKRKNFLNDNAALYTPIFISGKQTVMPVDYLQSIFDEAKKLVNGLRTQLTLQGLEALKNAAVVRQFSRGRFVPTHIPASLNPNDFDSGSCDELSNTAFGIGDAVKVFDFGLEEGWCFAIGNGQMSFLPRSSVGYVPEETNTLYRKHYVGERFLPVVINGRNVVLAPGNALFYNEDTDRYLIPRSIRTVNPNLPTMSTVLFTNPVSEKLFVRDFEELGQVASFIRYYDILYTPEADCSSVIQRALRVYGLDLPRHSGDISDELERTVGVVNVHSIYELNQLPTGLYIAEMYDTPAEEGSMRKSRHMYMVEVDQNGDLTAYSQAFNIIADNGRVEYPVGLHVCHKRALEIYIKDRGRFFRFHKIGT